jgi:hypothetical protein
MTTAVPLAAGSGAIAFGLILALFVVTVLLWLSMRRHLGRIDVDGDGADQAPGRGSGDPPSPDAPAPERRDE